LGAWRVDLSGLDTDTLRYEFIHLIFDPGRKSHPRAEEVHGYSDWILRHQQPFSEHAETISDFISSADLVVAHNAAFDLGFISRELLAVGKPDLSCASQCTMNAYRQSGLPGRASLNAVCEKFGLQRAGKRHGALEDAWLALMVHYWLTKAPSKFISPFGANMETKIRDVPSNFREPPPMPNGPLPRRRAHGIEFDRTASINTQAIFKEVRPVAILLLEIARAGGPIVHEEVDILTSLVRSVSERLNVRAGADDEAELLAELLDIKTSQNLLTRSARAMCSNPIARAEFPRWLATMATADGNFTPAEREAVDRVKAAITRVI
jgi:DNA polymerase-3 subunit epsilon